MARFARWCFVLGCFALLAGPALAGRLRQVTGPEEGQEGRFASRRLAESAIPEPGAMALFALGAAAVGYAVRRSRRT